MKATINTGCEAFVYLLSVHQAECTTRCKSKPSYNFAEHLAMRGHYGMTQ